MIVRSPARGPGGACGCLAQRPGLTPATPLLRIQGLAPPRASRHLDSLPCTSGSPRLRASGWGCCPAGTARKPTPAGRRRKLDHSGHAGTSCLMPADHSNGDHHTWPWPQPLQQPSRREPRAGSCLRLLPNGLTILRIFLAPLFARLVAEETETVGTTPPTTFTRLPDGVDTSLSGEPPGRPIRAAAVGPLPHIDRK